MAVYATSPIPALPAEIMDVVIDQLHSDLQMLGVCGMVCSEWLIRSRCHIFSTVQLWPWRVRRFFELSRSKQCTFTSFVNCIEVDDAQAKNGQLHNDDHEFLFHKALSSSSFSRFTHIESLRIRNVDWTLLPPPDQDRVRQHLASFTKLKALEFDDVMFHDLREIVRITSSLPSLHQLVTNVEFSKYMEHAITSAATLTLPNNLDTLRLGTDDAIPVLLNTTFKGSRLSRLILDGVKFWHLQHVSSALRSLRKVLKHLQINFSKSEGQWINSSDLAQLDLAHQMKLKSLYFNGIVLTSQTTPYALELDLPRLISKIPLTCNMKQVSLGLTLESESAILQFSWSALERVLATMMNCHLHLDIFVSRSSPETGDGNIVEKLIHDQLRSLRRSGRLGIRFL